MSRNALDTTILHEALEALEAHNGNVTHAAESLGLERRTLSYRLSEANRRGVTLSAKSKKVVASARVAIPEVDDEDDGSKDFKIRSLETQLLAYKKGELSARMIRAQIMKMAEVTPQPPKWLERKTKSGQTTGVPTLMCSDWHWGEVIDPDQIGGVNEYNLEIAHKRARRLIESTINLLKNHLHNPVYPGFVLILGGDMVSGDIHEELVETNEIPLIPAMLDLLDVLIWIVETLVAEFGALFVPCVTGNHGRNTHKIRAKGRHHTSFDWLVYTLLQKHFINDPRVTFMIPDGPDAFYRVFDHKYLLTHGDQFRGGDGVIGALGPIIRGDHRKRSRNAQIDMAYDTMMIGHWHQLIQMQRLIVNGSLCGYNEYAYANNFGFEVPRQALWITHPQHGITFSMPVNAEDVDVPQCANDAAWVSVKAKK